MTVAAVVTVMVIGVAAVVLTMRRRTDEARAGVGQDAAARDLARLRSVLDNLATGIVMCDERGNVVFRNAAARSLAGTHAGLLIDDTVERHLADAVAGTASEQLVELYGPPTTVVVVRAMPVDGGGGCAFVDDISERRRIDAVRTDFVANISHELKTPVGALAVLAETLVDETDHRTVSRIADRMLDEAHRAARTIDDLLELSRIELGTDLAHDDVAVRDVITCAIERVDALAERRGIRVTMLDTDDVTVFGDRRQLISAVGNLVENAVKYSEPSGVVHVTARVVEPWVEFTVVDQGVGIPTRDLDRIFERFYRVDKARSRGTGGSGLGLSIVRHVATNHGGDVLVSSIEGEGSTFVLRIPHHRASRDATSSSSPSHADAV